MSSFFKINTTGLKQFQRFTLSLSNVSRSAFISLIGLFINYVLLNYKSHTLLDAYVYCIAAVNLLMVFCNWGGKDYSTKLLVAEPAKLKETLTVLLNSRLLLFVPAIFVTLFIPAPTPFRVFILLYLFLKVMTSVFESVITLQKKFHIFLIIDFCLNALLLFVIIIDSNKDRPEIFFIELLIIEFLRLIICCLFFKNYITFKFDLKKSLELISSSGNFFLLALAGFICSRADLYVVGLRLDGHSMSRYFILLNLASLSQVCYSAFVSTFSSNIFRYNQKAFSNFSAYSGKAGFVFSVLSAAGIYLISNYYYRIDFDPGFTALMFLNVFIFTQVLTQMYHYTRASKQKTAILVLVISGALNIILSLFLCIPFGIKGAFISNTICMLCIFILLKVFSADERG